MLVFELKFLRLKRFLRTSRWVAVLTDTFYGLNHDKGNNPQDEHRDPDSPDWHRRNHQEHTKGDLDKTETDDRQPPDSMDPLPDPAPHALRAISLQVGAATSKRVCS